MELECPCCFCQMEFVGRTDQLDFDAQIPNDGVDFLYACRSCPCQTTVTYYPEESEDRDATF